MFHTECKVTMIFFKFWYYINTDLYILTLLVF